MARESVRGHREAQITSPILLGVETQDSASRLRVVPGNQLDRFPISKDRHSADSKTS